ncbi:hypothetical protein F8M41_002566 [Gigaspora margarita]|uniref:Uncharacterized protein n=1 Tax=Gigaspora margarita TaxID=4874 RepID=A0A8H4AYH4_GIGMA|nr:hypothetical protein F8M41_002566 [Gigaspora margarita]
MLTKKRKSLTTSRSVTKNRRLTGDLCYVGWYNNKERLNTCNTKYGIEVQIEKHILGAYSDERKTFYYNTLWNRLFFHRFFQEKSRFTNFELCDISIHIKIATYHNRL